MLKHLVILLQLYDTPQEAIAACDGSMGCATVENGICHVHAPRPQMGYIQDLNVIAHELLHCAVGDFHAAK